MDISTIHTTKLNRYGSQLGRRWAKTDMPAEIGLENWKGSNTAPPWNWSLKDGWKKSNLEDNKRSRPQRPLGNMDGRVQTVRWKAIALETDEDGTDAIVENFGKEGFGKGKQERMKTQGQDSQGIQREKGRGAVEVFEGDRCLGFAWETVGIAESRVRGGKNAFCKLKKSFKRYTDLGFRGRSYMFSRKPLGLKISGTGIYRDLEQCLSLMLSKSVRSRLNDLVVHSRTLAEHLELVNRMLRALGRGRGVKIWRLVRY